MVSERARSYLANRVTREQARAIHEFIDSLPEPSGDIFEVIEEAEYEAARRMNPNLPPFTYLVIHLTGRSVSGGGVNHEIANEILGPIGAEIQAAADRRAHEAEMSLVRISQGSLVLYYQPMQPLAALEEGHASIDISPVDEAVRRTFDLHNMLERSEDAGLIARRFGENQKFLRTARSLIEALDKFDLNMNGRWRSPTGGRAASQLTEAGRNYARRVFERIDRPSRIMISGRITALDLDGIVTVQQTSSKKRRVHVPDPITLTGGTFRLGQEVQFLVEIIEKTDQVGLSGREYLQLVADLTQEELELG